MKFEENFTRNKRTKPNLNDDERRVFKRIPRYLQKLATNLSKRGNYQKNYLYGID